MIIRLSIAAAALALGGAAVSVSAQEAQQEAQPEAKAEKKRCVSEPMTGSRTRFNKVCKTEAEWRESRNRTRKGLEEMGQAAAGGTNSAWQPGTNGQ